MVDEHASHLCDVALSYAGEDRGYVAAVADGLREAGVRVFYDERPRLALLNLASGAAQGANLRSSDYQKPLPDITGHDGTLLVTSSDTSRRYVLVPDVGGCFG